MKFFANRNIWKKIVIVLSLIFSMSFVKPAPVNASLATAGGELMEPICDLLVWLGDGFLGVAHSMLVHQETTIIRVDLNNVVVKVLRVVITIAVFLLVLAAAVALTGLGLMAVGAIAAKIGLTISATAVASTILFNVLPVAIEGGLFFGAKAWSSDMFDNEIDLPLYSISPERIFSNTIPFFDVNFFNPNSKPFEYEWIHKKGTNEDAIQKANEYWSGSTSKYLEDFQSTSNPLNSADSKVIDQAINNGNPKDVKSEFTFKGNVLEAKEFTYNEKRYIYWKAQDPYSRIISEGWYIEKTEEEKKAGDDSAENKGTDKVYTMSYELANTVKFWYNIMRTLAIVGMMSVLVYIGIRILLSSTAEQQAKQKKLFGDWLVGMVLLFTMQYIMVFANIAVDHLTEMFRSINPMGQAAFIPDKDGLVEKELKKYNIEVTSDPNESPAGNNMKVYKTSKQEGKKLTGEEGEYIEWHTDLMGHLRIALQANANSGFNYIGYTIMFIVMIAYTVIFIVIYIKRVIYMAFLTVIAPLVALTYPIDKANDGSAQGFNYWFKEYIFNLLLQPVHLLTYTILVSTAIKFATSNWLYSLIVLGFITQAEKIVRQMFNFSKASTPGVFAGPAGTALAMSGMRWLMGRGPIGGPRGGRSSGGNGSSSENDSGITSSGDNQVQVNANDLDDFLNGDSNSSHTTNNPTLGQGDNNSTASIINVGNNGAGDDNSSTHNGITSLSRNNNDPYQDADFWDNYGTDVFPYEDDSVDQIWDQPWDYEDTNELIDGNDGSNQDETDQDTFYQNGNNQNEYLGTEDFNGEDGTDQIRYDNNVGTEDITGELTDPTIEEDTSTGYGGSTGISGSGGSYTLNNSIGTNSRTGMNEGTQGEVSNGRTNAFSSNRGSSGNSTPNTTGSNNNQGQTGTAPESRTNRTSSRRRLPIASDIAQRNQEKISPREYIESKESAEAIEKRRRNEERAKRRKERLEEHPIAGRAINAGAGMVDKIADKTRGPRTAISKKAEVAKTVAGAVAGHYADNIQQNVKKSFKEGRPGKKVARTIAGVAGAATFGTLGVGLSVASGDFKTVAGGGIAGVAGGYKLGKGVSDSIDNVVRPEEVKEVARKAVLGNEEYRKTVIEENQREKALDPARIKRIQDKKGLSKKAAREYALQDDHKLYMENKIDDVDDWMLLDSIKGQEMLNPDGSKSGKKINAEMAVKLFKEYKRSGMESKEHDKTIDKVMSDLGLKDNDKDRSTAEWWYHNMKLIDDKKNG